MTTFDKVYAAVRLIPRGSVATYGQIAAAIGNKRLARVVGYALHVNPQSRASSRVTASSSGTGRCQVLLLSAVRIVRSSF